MHVLALYIKEERERNFKGQKKIIECMPNTDKAICRALEKKGHDVVKLDYNSGELLDVAKGFDVIFNLCDGLEDDTDFIEFKILQDIEKTGIPFTGNRLSTIKLCNDKRRIKDVLVKNNILTPVYQVFKSPEETLDPNIKFPVIVKPVCADAAVGIYADSVVNNEKDLKDKVKRVLEVHEQPAALVSEYIEGRDLTIPVMGNKNIKALYPIELKYIRSYKNRPNILSYGAKWAKGKPIYKDCITFSKNPEKRFSRKELDLIDSVARKVYKAMGCTGYATVDARLDKDGNVFVIEINPNCWIGPRSDTALSLKANYDIDFPGMIDKIVRIALER